MKTLRWFCLWGIMLAVCITAGLYTRASITDFEANQEKLMNSPYLYVGGTEITLKCDSKDIIEKSQLIVVCKYNGVREMQNRCFLSQVNVTDVLKGDKNIIEKTINVYEPIGCYTESVASFKISSGYDMFKSKFHFEDNMKFISISSEYQGYLSSTLMTTSNEYLLLLKPREYYKSDEAKIKSPDYRPIESPYSKLTLDSNLNKDTYIPPQEYISLKESLQYEILIRDKQGIEMFFRNKNEIINSLQIH